MTARPIASLTLAGGFNLNGEDAGGPSLRIDAPPTAIGAPRVCRIHTTGAVPLGPGGYAILAWQARRIAAALGVPEFGPAEMEVARRLCRDAADPAVGHDELGRILEELAELLIARTAVAST